MFERRLQQIEPKETKYNKSETSAHGLSFYLEATASVFQTFKVMLLAINFKGYVDHPRTNK